MDSWHLGVGQTGSSTNEAGFHLSCLIGDERRPALPWQEGGDRQVPVRASRLGDHNTLPLAPAQAGAASSAFWPFTSPRRDAPASRWSQKGFCVPGRGHRVAGRESIPRTLVLLRGRAASCILSILETLRRTRRARNTPVANSSILQHYCSPKAEVDGGKERSWCPSPPRQHLASGKQQLPPSLGFLGGERQRSQLRSACIQSKTHPLPCAAEVSRPASTLSNTSTWRQSSVEAKRGSETALGLLSHVAWSFFFVPGKPPYMPNSAILRLSRVAKALVVFLTDSLVRRLSLALFLTLTVGHHKGISTGCSVGSVGHQGICCSRTTLTFKMQVGDFLPASFLPCPSSPVCRPTDPATALRGKKLTGRVLTGTSISTKAEGEDGTEKAALRGKSSIACKSTRDLTSEQATRRQEKGDLGGRHPRHKMENC